MVISVQDLPQIQHAFPHAIIIREYSGTTIDKFLAHVLNKDSLQAVLNDYYLVLIT